MRKHIPNFITLCNLFFGCLAIVSVLYNQFYIAFWCILASAIADFFDGLAARLLNVKSTMGKELDSLADMVSFGAVPGAIFYMLLQKSGTPELQNQLNLMATPGFIFTLFACLRLAKFNIDTRQSENFIGLPTPAATIFTVGLMLIYQFNSFELSNLVSQKYVLYPSILVLSFLMVSEIEMFSLKMSSFKWRGNEIKFIFAALSLLLIVFLKEVAFCLVIIFYVSISLVQALRKSIS